MTRTRKKMQGRLLEKPEWGCFFWFDDIDGTGQAIKLQGM